MRTYHLTREELLTSLRESFQSDGGFPLEITGWSMQPLLRHGRDTVWLRPFHRESCKKGSILLYQRLDGRLVLHRVRKCLPDGYRMNGDAQSMCENISVEQIIAQAERIYRSGRMISCSAPGLKLWDALWYPTRPIRPFLFQTVHCIRKVIDRKSF